MEKYLWKPEELQLLEEWDWVEKYIITQDPEAIQVSDLVKSLLLEAKLIICNRLVIVYSDNLNNPVSIVSFKEFLELLENSRDRGNNIDFHPINFKTIREFRKYLSTARERMFSMLN